MNSGRLLMSRPTRVPLVKPLAMSALATARTCASSSAYEIARPSKASAWRAAWRVHTSVMSAPRVAGFELQAWKARVTGWLAICSGSMVLCQISGCRKRVWAGRRYHTVPQPEEVGHAEVHHGGTEQ